MIESHRISELPYHFSPNVGGVMENLPSAIVVHYSGNDSLSSTVNWLCDRQARASAHIIIGESGEMVQLVPFNQIAWHAGKSDYQGLSNFNTFSIGVELVNPGKLTRVGKAYQAWFGADYPYERVVTTTQAKNKNEEYWCAYPTKQLKALKHLVLLLKSHYPIKLLVGHEEIAPGRKVDPGPAFPLDDLRRQLMNIDRDGLFFEPDDNQVQLGKVTASKLNIRNSIQGMPRSGPLNQGKELKILEENDGWLKVLVEETGWVKKEYVSIIDGD